MRKYLPFLSVLIWMSVIFYLSHQPGTASSQLSTGLTKTIGNAIQNIIPAIDIDFGYFNHLVRKNVHFFAYLTLAILTINAIVVWQRDRLMEARSSDFAKRKIVILKRKQFYRAVGFTLLICMLYAVSDEVHQLFIDGRSGEIGDVVIDTVGAATGIVIFLFVGRVRRFFWGEENG